MNLSLKKTFSCQWFFLTLLFSVIVIFSFPFWWQGKIPFSSTYLVTNFPPWQYYFGMPVKNDAMPDVNSQIIPWRRLVIESLKKREWPLWNPYSFAGTPLLANYQAAPFHPANFLFFLFPFLDAWSLLILLQPFLASIFTFFYLREIKISLASATIGSLAFGFCGFLVCWLAYGTLPWAILWLPLSLFSIEKILKKIWWGGPLFSFSLAFSLFSGHFQTSLYLLLVVFAYLLFLSLKVKNLKKAALLFLYFLLGIFLASPQLLPTWEFYQQSIRSGNFTISGIIPFRYLVTLLSPDFFGSPITRNKWFGHYAEWASFIGVFPLILATYALFFRQKSHYLRFFSFLGLFSLLTVIRSPIQNLIVFLKIPVLSTSSFSRVIVIFSFSLAIISAFGLEQLRLDWRQNKLKRNIFFLFFWLIIFLLVWTFIFFGKFSSQPPEQLIRQNIAKRNFLLPSFIFLITSFGFLLGFFSKKLRPIIIFAFIFLTIFDLLRFAKKWQPFESPDYFYPRLPVIQALQEKTTQNDRVFGNFGSELNFFQIPGIEGYDPLFIRRFGEFITAASEGKISQPSALTVLINKNGQQTTQILNLLGVKYILHAKDDGRNIWAFPFWQHSQDFKLIWEDDKYQIYENKKAFARAFFVADYQIAQNDQGIINLMLSDKTDLSKTIILEKEPPIPFSSTKIEPSINQVAIRKFSPTKIQIEAETDQSRLLFLSDVFYPGWNAFVDQEKAPLLRANFIFQSLVVPAGKHQVTLVYNPPLFKIGLGLGLFSLLSLISISFYWRKNENWPF